MNILIVESAAKARTLERYLGPDWTVVATGGHVQTLPHNRKEHGKDAKKAYWANRPGELPSPPWVWTDRGEDAVDAILEHADDDAVFWIATDPDREGEFIAWCLENLLESKGRAVHRVSFQEVTERAVKEAVENPGQVDRGMIESALIRKFVDRLVGYRTSKLARAVIPGGSASMGRVQTPTLGFVVDRELERDAHVPIPYFEVRARAETIDLKVRFHEPGDPDVWKDDKDKANPSRTFDETLATEAEAAIRSAGRVEVTEVNRGNRVSRPRDPFSTDALLQAAGSRFGWSPRKTSALASNLYEAGHITYIRTDSTRLATSAVETARSVIRESFGEDHLGSKSSGGSGKGTGPVQDAHEAIRPTDLTVEEAGLDDADARKLYRLVRAHTLASLMAPSRYDRADVRATAEGLERPLTGSISWRTFPGWEAVYAEFRREPPTSPPAATLEVGASWTLDPEAEGEPNPELVEDETQPPPRYRRHTLIKAMKDAGIGRPSTYARTVEKLEERTYVEIDEGALKPTERGHAIWNKAAPLYVDEETGNELFSADFTARMEARLDAVSRGGDEHPAGPTWEEWRDQIRELHETARARKDSGLVTPRTMERLTRLLENLPEELESEHSLSDADPKSMTEEDARAWIERLGAQGVKPAPTARQMDYIETMVEELEFSEEEAAALIDKESLGDIRTSVQASALIEELATLRDERRPPSRKQVALIERLRTEAKLSEEDAAKLIDEPDLEGLTGGREGTASALIDALLERAESAKAD